MTFRQNLPLPLALGITRKSGREGLLGTGVVVEVAADTTATTGGSRPTNRTIVPLSSGRTRRQAVPTWANPAETTQATGAACLEQSEQFV
jgi:hypothetical protein